jgi:hypothetical protein
VKKFCLGNFGEPKEFVVRFLQWFDLWFFGVECNGFGLRKQLEKFVVQVV